jgi:hypothetical protein
MIGKFVCLVILFVPVNLSQNLKPEERELTHDRSLYSSEGYSKKTFHHKDTEDTEKFKKQSDVLCALCVSSERNERMVKRIINPDNNDWSEVDHQIVLLVFFCDLYASA